MAKKPSLGRQKIKITKIEKNNILQVTFSKRRFGLFKKASELVTLCGVEISIIVSSPGGKIFSFGHPNIDFIVDKFLINNPSVSSNFVMHSSTEVGSRDNLEKLSVQLENILDELEEEKKRGKFFDNIKKESIKSCWWRAPIDNLGLSELEQTRVSMEQLKENVTNEANKRLVEGLNVQADFSSSFNSFGEKVPLQIFDFSENYNFDHLGYNPGFC